MKYYNKDLDALVYVEHVADLKHYDIHWNIYTMDVQNRNKLIEKITKKYLSSGVIV